MSNNKTKIFLLLTLVFITILGVSAVTAADNDNITADTTQIVDDATAQSLNDGVDSIQTDVSTKNTLINKKSNDNVKGDGEATFADLEADIASSDVKLAKDYIQAEDEGNITITTDKTIDGDGHTIAATKGIFIIDDGVTVTLKNMNIVSSHSINYNYSFYDLHNKGNLIIDNVTFKYNSEERTWGGQIYVDANSNLTVTNSIFDGENNPRSQIYANGNDYNINIDKSTFTNYNTQYNAIYLNKKGNLTLTNSKFINNIMGEYGGALYLNAQKCVILVENCTFENLTAKMRGGAICANYGDITVKDSTFKNLVQNASSNNAGAIFVGYNYASLYLENNVMENNTSRTADIYFSSGNITSDLKVVGEDLVVDQEAATTLEINVTDDNGNSVDFRSSPFTVSINDEVISVTYVNGTLKSSFDASYEPGVYPITITYNDEKILGNVEIPDLKLIVNDIGLLHYSDVQALIDASEDGIISIEKPVIKGTDEDVINVNKDVTIDFNGNSINAKGGRVFNVNNEVTIKNAVITNVNNKDVLSGNDKIEGRIAIVNGSEAYLEFENVNFTNSTAPSNGNAATGSFILIFAPNTPSTGVSLKDCYIENCTGTFINNVGGDVYIEKTTFANNKLSSNYYSLIANGGALKVVETNFVNNTANFAVIEGQSQSLAWVYGGTYLRSNRHMNITASSFINNGQTMKGAIHTNNDTDVTESVFINNTARGFSGYGGAIRSDNGYLNVEKSIFVNNTANSGNDGTAIYNSDGDLTIKDSIIISNITKNAAVYNDASGVEIDINGNYWGNSTPEGFYKSSYYGDAITVDNWVTLNVTVDPAEDIKFKDTLDVKAIFTNSADGTQVTTLPDYDVVTFSSSTGTFTEETVEITDNEAATTFTVRNSPFEITATYPNMEALYSGEAKMPEPMIITLNDGNFTEYFDVDATETATLKDFIVPNSELRFEGEFNDRYMIIDMPLNLTTADTQGVLKNSQFIILANNVNITKLQMISEDTEEAPILSEDAEHLIIADNTITVTNNEDETMTRAIVIDGGLDVTINNNTITTTGPEDKINYASDSSIDTLYLASIESTANKTTIINNKITTKKNEGEAQSLGTIYGVYVHGKNNNEKLNGMVIKNNEIITEGDIYDYGIKPSFVENSLIENNTVTTTSKGFSSGIHPFVITDSVIANNIITSKADNITYGIVLEGAMQMVYPYNVINSEDNLVENNTICLESSLAWAIELYCGNSNNITHNNITVTADYGLGVGVGDYESTISYNNIEVTSTNNKPSTANYDYIDPYTTGVKIANNGLQTVNKNVVTFNNITVSSENAEICAVNSSTNYNEITDNLLISPLGFGDGAVIDTGRYGTTEDNRPTLPITDENYEDYFDENGVLKQAYNNTDLVISGDFVENTVFLFDGVNVTFTNDGTATVYEGVIWTGNNATVVFDGLVLENSIDAIVLESEGNILNNTNITINSEESIHAIYVYEDGNTIANTMVYITAPSADVEYNPDYSTKNPAPAAIVIASDNNLIDASTVIFVGTESTGYYPTVDGIYIVSEKTPIENNTIKDTTVAVSGSNYVYGINVGNAKNTTLENVNVYVGSAYYADAIQLFDADGITITGKANAEAVSEAYGVYSTAMGYGFSQNIDLTGLDVHVGSAKATGVLIEGASNVMIADATYDIVGGETTAINAHVDFMGNVPTNITVTGLDVTINSTGDANMLYFGKAADVTVTDNHIEANASSAININATPNAVITDNYILVGQMLETGIFGNYAVTTTEDDTVVENNTPTSKLIDDLNDKISELEEQFAELTKAKETTVTIDTIEKVQYGDEITISGTLVNEDSLALSNQNITIKFNDEETTVTTRNGEFKYTTTATLIGENTVTAAYAGNDKYLASDATYTFTVEKGSPNIVIDELATVKKGDVLVISGTLFDQNDNALANKVVRLLVNNGRKTLKTDDMGAFSFEYTATRVGENTLTATFEGNNYYESTATSTEFTVNKLSTIITLESIEKVNKGSQATITGTLTDSEGNALANAQVKIMVNGSPKTVKTDSKGKFTHTYTFGQLGTNTITASYAGSTNYEESTTETTVDVEKSQTTITFNDIGDVTVGDTATISGTLTDTLDNVIANAQVKLLINGSQKTLKTDEFGVFTHTFKMTKEGTNNITATYNGNNEYTEAETATTVEVIKAE